MAWWRELARDQVPERHVWVFYVGIPATLACMNAFNGHGMARYLPIEISIPYWLLALMPAWLCLDVGTRFVALVMRPWTPPLWLILIAGALVAMVPMQPYVVWLSGLFKVFLPDGITYTVAPPVTSVFGEWERFIAYLGTPFTWLLVNYYYDRILDIPRYRGSPLELLRIMPAPHGTTNEGAGDPKAISPDLDRDKAILDASELVAQLPASIGRDIIAMKAEDHYVRVFTMLGNALIRYKFSTATKELADLDGTQVHRSFWVRNSAVKASKVDGTRLALIMENGTEIPVSRAYREVVRSQNLVSELSSAE